MGVPPLAYGTPKIDRVFQAGELKAQHIPGKCGIKGCRKRPHKRRANGRFLAFCPMHLNRRWKEANPARYALHRLRNNARRRGIPCVLTPALWEWFVKRHNLLALRGRTANALTVDRKKSWMCYCILTIQPMINSENARKQ